MTVPVTLSRGDAVLRIAPDRGFTAYSWQVAGVDYLYRPDGFPVRGDIGQGGIPVLFPWPNRIAGAGFSWRGRRYRLPVTDRRAGTSLHGYACRRPWRVIGRSDDRVSAEFLLSRDAADDARSWPADAGVRIDYLLTERTLRMTATVFCPDDRDLPFGFGLHPYFRLPGVSSDWTLRCAADRQWSLQDCLPTGPPAPVGPRLDFRDPRGIGVEHFDDALTGLSGGPGVVERAHLSHAGTSISVRSDGAFGHYVIFTPEHRLAVAIEPYTCMTDAVHLEERGIPAGWRVLPAGEQSQMIVEFAVIAAPAGTPGV